MFFMKNFYSQSQGRCFGTFKLIGEDLLNSFKSAFDVGYRFFDTAQLYDNEADLGQAIKKLGISRSEIFIITKVHPNHYFKDLFIPSVHESLKKLDTDYVDLLLLHWPAKSRDNSDSLAFLQEAHEQGLASHIGLSNYNIAMIKDAIKKLSIMPVTNQVEFHPLLDQSRLLSFANSVNLNLSSYCSVARGKIFEFEELNILAKKYNCTTAQISLSWALQKGVAINTMSSKYENIKNNYNILDINISNEDMNSIDTLSKKINYRIVTKELFIEQENPMIDCVPEWD